MKMNDKDDVEMIYSSVVSRDGKKRVCVRFERKSGNRTDFAEAMLPDKSITSSEGFSEEEIAGLEYYLGVNKNEILKRAGAITNIKYWMGSDNNGN